jgi:hypothetical protein
VFCAKPIKGAKTNKRSVIFFILKILMKLYNFENEENNWDEWKERWR